MVSGLIGKKIGMTQVFREDGQFVPATVIQAGPCVVVQKKTAAKEGYDSVQLGLVEFVKPARVNLPTAGHYRKAGVEPGRKLAEFRVLPGGEVNVGDRFTVEVFKLKEKVDVIATSIGRGFQGFVDLGAKDFGRQIEFPDLLVVQIPDIHFRHIHLFEIFLARRTMT